MGYKYDKKIQRTLKGANLSKSANEELKRELESYFYEKEHELGLLGLDQAEIEKQIIEEFGNEEKIGKHLQLVHKKSLYHFVISLMKNKNKPHIFESVFLFSLLVALFQNTVFDMATVVEMTQNTGLEAFAILQNNFRMWVLGGIFLLSFILSLRLFRGKSLAQKITGVLLFIVICIEIGITYSVIKRNVVFPERIEHISDQDILENYEHYEYFLDDMVSSFESSAGGYWIDLPIGYMAYLKNGEMKLQIHLEGNEEVSSFGPPYGSDKEKVDIEIYDFESATDKIEDETWFEYYLRTHLEDQKIAYNIKPEIEGDPISEDLKKMSANSLRLKLEETRGMKNDLILFEKYNRLYVFYYDETNPIHQEILFKRGPGFFVPENKIEWTRFDDPACPFSIEIPQSWTNFEYKKGQNFLNYQSEDIKTIASKDCNLDGFISLENNRRLELIMIENEAVEEFFNSNEKWIIRIGEVTWSEKPAKRLLIKTKFGTYHTVFAIQIEPGKWFAFIYEESMFPFKPNSIEQKILQTLQIKQNNQ